MNFVRHNGTDLDGFLDDNVLAVADLIQHPVLKIGRSQTNVLVFWPVVYADGFQLLQNTNLAKTNWTQVGSSFVITNGSNQFDFSLPPTNLNFRLFHP
jgi:hypothetical protein